MNFAKGRLGKSAAQGMVVDAAQGRGQGPLNLTIVLHTIPEVFRHFRFGREFSVRHLLRSRRKLFVAPFRVPGRRVQAFMAEDLSQ